MNYSAVEIFGIAAARLAQEYPAAVFDAGPEAPHRRINQQDAAPGGRVVMLPSAIQPGTRIFNDLEAEFRADLEVWDFQCFGYSEDPEAKWIHHYERAERLGDTIARAFFPYTVRIKFIGGKPGGMAQSPTLGALKTVSYAVLRPIGVWATAGTVAADGGAPDVGGELLSTFSLSTEVTR